ncbi:MAG: hypothetical protein BWY42_01693 [Candidatus Omnitrophica bacterium ADurb.Bin277]|nr:MAG: hypothetical protein BWY42_01693 [Candidatus Omnitrophica bacterium ADurb.Bin277]
MNGLGKNVLARSALSQEQNIGAASGNHFGLLYRPQKAGVFPLNIFKVKIGGRPHHPGHHGLGPLDFIQDNDLADHVLSRRQNRVAGQRKIAGKMFEKNADFRIGDRFLVFDQIKKLFVFPFKNIPEPPPLKVGILREAEHLPGIVVHHRHEALGIHRDERFLNRRDHRLLIAVSHAGFRQRLEGAQFVFNGVCRRHRHAQRMRVGAVIPAEQCEAAQQLSFRAENGRTASGRAVIYPDVMLRAEHLHGLFIKNYGARGIVARIFQVPAGPDIAPGRLHQPVLFGIAKNPQHIPLAVQKADHKSRPFQKAVQAFHERTAGINEFPVRRKQNLQRIPGQYFIFRRGKRIEAKRSAAYP